MTEARIQSESKNQSNNKKDSDLQEDSEELFKLDESNQEELDIYDNVAEVIKEKEQEAKKALKRLICVTFVCLTLMTAEIIGGVISGSLAVLADAAHLFSDFAGFASSIIALLIGRKSASTKYSFGYARAEVLGALISIMIIWGVTAWLVYEAVSRAIHSVDIDGKIMFITAVFGLGCNLVMMKVLHSHHDHQKQGSKFNRNALRRHSTIKELNRSKNLSKDSDEGREQRTSKPNIENKRSDFNYKKDVTTNQNDAPMRTDSQISKEAIDFKPKETAENRVISHDQGITTKSNGSLASVDLEQGEKKKAHSTSKKNQENEKKHPKFKFKNCCKRQKRSENPNRIDKKNESANKNMNVQAAAIHILGDTIQSIGVIIASILVWINPNLHLADPICTFIFSVLVMFTTFKISRRILRTLLEGIPLDFEMEEYKKGMKELPGVLNVHDVHVWTLSSGKTATSAHVSSKNTQQTLKKLTNYARGYGIFHSTFQVEKSDGANEDYKIICAHDLHRGMAQKKK